MRTIAGVLLAAGGGLLTAPAVQAQSGAGSIAGSVTEGATQFPLSGAQVQATSADGAVAGQAVTAEDGRYRIVSLAPGRYGVLVRLVGYAPRRDSVTVEAEGTASFSVALAAQANTLNAVVVSASRRAERAQEAPASVSVVGAQEIANRPAVTPAEHLRAVPGVDIAQTGITGTNVVARGFNAAFSSSLQILTDYRIAAFPGLQVNRFASISPTNEDIERMEVVLGPAAALYGPNTANGVLHVLTRSPLTSTGSVVSVAGGEQGSFLGSARTSQRIGENFGIKVSGQYFRANEFDFVDTSEVRLQAGAQAQLATFRMAQLALGRTAEQVDDSVRRDPALFALSRIGVRSQDVERVAFDVRADWRPTPSLTTVFQAGRSSSTNVDLTGISASAQDGFELTHYQARASAGRFFAQAYLQEGDAGGTYTTRTGTPVVDNSRLYVGQLQHGLAFGGDRQLFTYGFDALHTDPKSDGTVYGRNEDDDEITQLGAYLQSETRLTNRVRLVLAGRLDDHSVLDETIFSPRAAVVFEPVRNQNFRVTYNRAFQAPTAINFYLDRLSSRSGPYAVRAVSPRTDGYNFRLDDGSLAIRSPFNPAGTGGANTRIAYAPAAVSRLAINYLVAIRQITPAEAGRLLAANPNFTILGRNPQTGAVGALDPASIENLPGIDNELSEVFEVGYKGILGNRLQLGVDLWRLNRSNFISQLFAPAPLLLARGADVQAFLAANGIAADRAATLATLVASTPLGAVAAAENDVYTDGVPILITYKNYAEVDLTGLDLSAQALIGAVWRVSVSGSLVSDNYFTFAGEQPVALNAPTRKGTLAVGYDGDEEGIGRGIIGEARVRYVGGFPVYTGVYVGTDCVEPAGQGLGSCVQPATLFDLTLGYQIPQLTGTSVQLSVTNLFDRDYQAFVGVPAIGRLALLRLRQEF